MLNTWKIKDQQFNIFDFRKEFAKHYAVSQDLDGILIGYDNPNAQLFNRSGRLLQNLDGHKGNVVAVAIAPDGQQLAVVTNQGFLYVWKRKKDHKEFNKQGNYAELTTKEKLRFEVVDFNDIFRSYDGKELYDAANYYSEAAMWQDHSQQIAYLEKAHRLLWKLNKQEKQLEYILENLSAIERLQKITHSNRRERQFNQLENKLKDFDNIQELLQIALFFFGLDIDSYSRSTLDLNVKNYRKGMQFYESFINMQAEEIPIDFLDYLELHLNIWSEFFLKTGDYAESLKTARLANDLVQIIQATESIATIRFRTKTRLTLALFFNDQFDEAVQVITDYLKLGKVHKQLIIDDITALQRKGIINSQHDEIVQMIQDISTE